MGYVWYDVGKTDRYQTATTLQWRHNERDGVSNHRRYDSLLNRLFRHRSKKTPKLRITGLCEGNSPVTDDFPHKGLVTRKMFPFDDIFMGARQTSTVCRFTVTAVCLFFFNVNIGNRAKIRINVHAMRWDCLNCSLLFNHSYRATVLRIWTH